MLKHNIFLVTGYEHGPYLCHGKGSICEADYLECSAKQSGELGTSSEAVDGIVGFGQANTSILSQLALSGKVKKIFSHCLDGNKGGGIFAIGEVVQPKVNRTPLVPNEPHYNVILKAIEVGGQFLNLPTDSFDTGSSRGTIIDSGTTLAYLPSEVYQQLMNKVTGQQPKMETHVVERQFKCFWYRGKGVSRNGIDEDTNRSNDILDIAPQSDCLGRINMLSDTSLRDGVDDAFPVVIFHFENSLPLAVYPHDYLFEVRVRYRVLYRLAEQRNADKGWKRITLLGDIVLQDKLVLYDLENQTIGWTPYNCSSTIKVRDEASGNVYSVAAHNISSAFSLPKVNVVLMLLFIVVLLKLIE
ncbi:UNVERIFIED_CONTAM: Aspartic proteinase-like protein 2 [Sesamum calycinum]|uniref:Aspartic proteinase-like protein 2 n=1 Tax=Sesamum calycinum TaxID=2727403 RepID=A0AAW2LT27_9LAMI